IIGSVGADGITSEERKMTNESRKILGDPALDLVGTCIRVPTLISHATAVHCRTTNPVPDGAALREAFGSHPGIALMDDPNMGRFPTPVQAAGTDPVWVGRIRRFDEHTIGFYAVADNLRKGAALNAVQIGELLV
ncbi:MAG: Asd/ArgC dimerization domain-containing protein, partial [bacterium]